MTQLANRLQVIQVDIETTGEPQQLDNSYVTQAQLIADAANADTIYVGDEDLQVMPMPPGYERTLDKLHASTLYVKGTAGDKLYIVGVLR